MIYLQVYVFHHHVINITKYHSYSFLGRPAILLSPKNLCTIQQTTNPTPFFFSPLTYQHNDHVVLGVLSDLAQPRPDIVKARFVRHIVQQ